MLDLTMKKPKQFKPQRAKVKGVFSLESNKKNTGRSKGYDSEWEKYRWRFLYYNKNCYACGRDKESSGRSLNVDHIKAHKGNQEIFWDTKNHMPLCHSCHSIVTGRFDKFDEPKTLEKIDWIVKQRKMLGVNVTIKVISDGRKGKRRWES